MRLRTGGRVVDFSVSHLVLGAPDFGALSRSVGSCPDACEVAAQASVLADAGAGMVELDLCLLGVEQSPDWELWLAAFAAAWKGAERPALWALRTARLEVAERGLALGADLVWSGPNVLEWARLCTRAGAALGLQMTAVTLDSAWLGALERCEAGGLERGAVLFEIASGADGFPAFSREGRLRETGCLVVLDVVDKQLETKDLGAEDGGAATAREVACVVEGMLRGALGFRVRDVRAAVQTVRTVGAVLRAGAGLPQPG